MITRRALPAIVGAALIAAIVVVVVLRRGDDAPASTTATRTTPHREPAPGARNEGPALTHDHAAPPTAEPVPDEPLPDEPLSMSEEERRRTGLYFPEGTDPELKAEVEEQRKDWDPLDYDEMVDKSKPFLETLRLRESLLVEEIETAEKAGDAALAARRRIELERLRKRKAELEKSLSEGKLP